MFYENRLGIKTSVISLFTCFVRIPARNSVNPIIQITRFPTVIMSDALEEHDGKVSIGGRTINNLQFADDIDSLAKEEQEQEVLVESLDKTCTRYRMKISSEKDKTNDK